jgi:hypothetical protein
LDLLLPLCINDTMQKKYYKIIKLKLKQDLNQMDRFLNINLMSTQEYNYPGRFCA